MGDEQRAAKYPLQFSLTRGRFAVEEDRSAYVRQLIRQVILTAPGERIMRPEFGCGVRDMLFMPNSPVAANLARITIYQALEEYMGRHIEVESVEIEAHQEVLNITVRYLLKATKRRQSLAMEMSL